VLALVDNLSAMRPMAWMAFLATMTFTSVAYSLEREREREREGVRERGSMGVCA